MSLEERSKKRQKKIVGYRAKSFADAEKWDLEFWQNHSPQVRLSAMEAIKKDIKKVRSN